jgi:hypothetical protein
VLEADNGDQRLGCLVGPKQDDWLNSIPDARDLQMTTRENIRAFQAKKLGRSGGNILLTGLMPIPKPKVKRWDYDQLLPQFESRE